MKDSKSLSRGLWMFSLLKNLLEKDDLKKIGILDLVEAIRTGKINDIVFVHYIMELRDSNVSSERKKIIKTKLLPAIVSSGVCTGTVKSDNFGWHNGLVQCDFDPTEINKKIFGETLMEVQNFIDTVLSKDEFTCVAFLSPSGWIKLLVKISPENPENQITHLKEAQNVYVKIIARYFKDKYGLEMDMACSDLSRLMLMSYDPDVYYNKDSKQFRIDMGLDILEEELTKTHRKKVRATSTNKDVNVSDVEWAVSQVEEQGVNITAGYERWMLLSFSLASLSENGRSFFHRISKIDSTYNQNECDKQFDNALNSFDPSRSSIATFFYFCKEFGIIINNKKSKTMNNDKKKKEVFSNEPLDGSIFENHPQIFKDIIAPFADDPRKRDVIFLSCLSAISTALVNVQAYYGSKVVRPNFYCFIIAPAASHKGLATFCTFLLSQIDRELKDYQHISEEVSNSKSFIRLMILPENISSAAAIELLCGNKNCFMFASEADRISDQNKQDFGNWSELQRALHHHESYSCYRKAEGKLHELRDGEGRLSMTLTGTPEQVRRLIHERENGLFSRFYYYYFNEQARFQNPLGDVTDLGAYYSGIGKEVYKIHNTLSRLKEERIFSLTDKQGDRFFEHFKEKQLKLEKVTPQPVNDILFRLALTTFRYAMTLSILRDVDGYGIVTCTDEDLTAALVLSDCLMKNALSVVSLYGDLKSEDLQELAFKELPDEFETKDAKKVMEVFDDERTVFRTLKRWQKEGRIRKVKIGFYVKTK